MTFPQDPITDPTGALTAAGVAPGLIQQVMSQPFVGFDLGLLQQQNQQSLLQAQQGFGNTEAQLGVERGALQREEKYLPEQQALQSALLGLSGQDLGLQRQQLGLRGQSLDITQQQEQQAADQALQGAQSSATARGAINTQGYGQQRGYINQNLQNQLAQLGLSRQGLGLQGQGLDIQGQRLGVEGQQQQIGDILQTGSLADQMAQLNIQNTIAGQSLQNNIFGAGQTALSGGANILSGAANNTIAGAQGVPTTVGQSGAVAGINPPQNHYPGVA